MPRATPGIKSRRWHKLLRQQGCELIRTKGGHAVYEAPNGQRIVCSIERAGGGPSFREVTMAATALGLTTEELIHS